MPCRSWHGVHAAYKGATWASSAATSPEATAPGCGDLSENTAATGAALARKRALEWANRALWMSHSHDVRIAGMIE